MTTLQLNQEVLRQIGYISHDDTLLTKVIAYIKSIVPAKVERHTSADKAAMLEHIAAMTKPCPLTEEEIDRELEQGRQEFYDKMKQGNECYH